MTQGTPRPNVDASFPSGSEYADFVLRVERPVDSVGREVLDRGWDLLYVKRDGSVAYNHWAGDWDQVLMYFSSSEEPEAPAWVHAGKFKDAIFPTEG